MFGAACVAFLLPLAAGFAAQTAADREAQFRRLAARLADQRRTSAEEPAAPQEQALLLLDGIVLEALNTPDSPNLEMLNQKLAALVSHQPAIGEGYQAFLLGAAGPSSAYALLADFGLSGPSAVRIYAGGAGRYRLTARIDRFAWPGFLDDYLELVPLPNSPAVFVTVAGRTDELQTGSFAAWRFDGNEIQQLWSSDLLEQSSYETSASGFTLTYCAESEEDRPETCRRRARERYAWEGGTWKRVEQAELPITRR
jgi:hypothetical protein